MSTPSHLARHNITVLNQGLQLLSRLDDGQYTRVQPPVYTSCVGAHFRHALDHYINLLSGWPGGEVNYHERMRERGVEEHRRFAMEKIEHLVRGLSAITEADVENELRVKVEEEDPHAESDRWTRSTLHRELDFLLSHTIHHYALIALILRTQGVDPGPDFGVAPATLRYWQTQS